jgi:plasmid stabilization system protein ParE
MSLGLQKADAFVEDFTLQALWYVREAGDEVARRFQRAVDSRLYLLCEQPGVGRVRRFRHPKLQGLRSFAVERPFHRFVIFYREDGVTLQAVRLMDGTRDLPRRLVERPGSESV